MPLTGPGGVPLALRLSEGLGLTSRKEFERIPVKVKMSDNPAVLLLEEDEVPNQRGVLVEYQELMPYDPGAYRVLTDVLVASGQAKFAEELVLSS